MPAAVAIRFDLTTLPAIRRAYIALASVSEDLAANDGHITKHTEALVQASLKEVSPR